MLTCKPSTGKADARGGESSGIWDQPGLSSQVFKNKQVRETAQSSRAPVALEEIDLVPGTHVVSNSRACDALL